MIGEACERMGGAPSRVWRSSESGGLAGAAGVLVCLGWLIELAGCRARVGGADRAGAGASGEGRTTPRSLRDVATLLGLKPQTRQTGASRDGSKRL